MIARPASLVFALSTLALLGACGSTSSETRTASSPAGPVGPVVTSVPPGVTYVEPGTVIVAPSTGSSVAPAHLSGAEVRGLLSGNTASGMTSAGQPYIMRFSPSGSVTLGEAGSLVREGTWQVTPDGRLCSQFDTANTGFDDCYTLHHSGPGYVFEGSDGHPAGNFTVTPGV
jgi:hypothetical protein